MSAYPDSPSEIAGHTSASPRSGVPLGRKAIAAAGVASAMAFAHCIAPIL